MQIEWMTTSGIVMRIHKSAMWFSKSGKALGTTIPHGTTDKELEIWLPVSQIFIEEDGDERLIHVPNWLAKEKHLLN